MLRNQRQLQQQQSRSSPPENEEGDSVSLRTTSSLPSFALLRSGSVPTSSSIDNILSILDLALALADECDEDVGSSVISMPRSDSNSEH
jgi:hypothetical protein